MDEAWLHILKHLNIQETIRSRRVSPYFDRLCRKALRAHRHIDIELDCPMAISDPEAISRIIEGCGACLLDLTLRVQAPNEKYASIPSTSHVTTSVMKSICLEAKRLKSLKIDRMIMTLGAIEKFGELPESLEEVRISNTLMSCSEWDVVTKLKKGFEKMLKRCHNLRIFEISGRSLYDSQFHLDPSVLQFLPQSIEQLSIAVGSSLKIEHLSFLKGKQLKSLMLQRSFISASSIDFLVEMSQSLTHLDLSFSPNLLDTQQISKLNMLKSLMLSNNRDGVDDVSLQKIIRGCSKLEHLSLDQCSFLTHSSLMCLGELRNLKKLALSGVSNVDDKVCLQISKCLRLTFLDLNFCRKIHKQGLQYLLSSLIHLNHLEVLGISAYSHKILVKHSTFPKTIVCDSPIQTFSFSLPPIPNLVAA